MTDLLVDPRFWGAVAVALFVGFLIGLLVMALLRGNDRPEVIGAIRRRCQVCDINWSEPSTEDGLELCADCRKSLEWRAT